jgi:dTDP-4-dehydrorhamnose 3,5-epimerase
VIFHEAALPGAFIIEMERREDERGYFARAWCEREFAAHGLNTRVAQCSVSFNRKRGTLRGLHYQVAPYEEAKLVRCTRGAIYDVIVDLRPSSPTFLQWAAVRLMAQDGRMLYVPEGCAHGFQTFLDDTEVFYQMSECYAPECARGVRWDDPAFRILWPAVAERIISPRDRDYPDFEPEALKTGTSR